MRKYLRQGVVAQSALVFAGTMVPSVFFFIFHFALSRQLGVERYGALSSLISLLIIAGVPSGIGATIVMKFTAEFHALEDWAKLRTFVHRSLQAGAVVGAFSAFIAFAMAQTVANYLNIREIGAIWITGVVLGLSFVLPLLRAVLQGQQDYLKFAISTTIDALGRAVFGVLLVRAGFGLAGALGGVAIATALSVIYTLFVVLWPLRGKAEPVTIDIRRIVQSSAGVGVGGLFGTVLGFVDLPLVKHFFSAQDAGLYGAASLAGKVVLYALAFVPILVIPKAASRLVRGEPTPIVLMSALAATAAVSLPALLILGFFPELVLKVLTGTAYLAASPMLLMYGIAMSLAAGSMALGAYSVAVHRFHYLVPVGIAAFGEMWGIQLFHQTLTQVLVILIAANAVACLGTLALSFSPKPISRPAIVNG